VILTWSIMSDNSPLPIGQILSCGCSFKNLLHSGLCLKPTSSHSFHNPLDWNSHRTLRLRHFHASVLRSCCFLCSEGFLSLDSNSIFHLCFWKIASSLKCLKLQLPPTLPISLPRRKSFYLYVSSKSCTGPYQHDCHIIGLG
jgi:hypothetical protein